MNHSQIKQLRIELAEAAMMRNVRAAFSSIARRHMDDISRMSPTERTDWITSLQIPATYVTELNKELAAWRYDRARA